MIRKIEVENFMSLKETSVEFNPLTVFIGPNGSGKSAIFKALVTLSKLINGVPIRGPKGEFATDAGVTFDDMVWRGNSGLPIKFRVWFADDGDEPGYSLELRKGYEGWSVTHERIRAAADKWVEIDEDHPFEFPTERGTPKVLNAPLRATLSYLVRPSINDSASRPTIDPVLRLVKRFGQAYRYRPSASDIASFVARPTEKDRAFYVGENGWGVAAELQALQGSSRKTFEAIETAVCQLFPHIQAIGFKSDWRGVRLSFRTDRSEDLIPAPQESDGVLLTTFLFWRLYTAGSELTVCLEEPENGLHPFLLAGRFEILKRFACAREGVGGPQLLIATHSPEFLRAIKAHPTCLWEELRLVEFTHEGGCSVKCLQHYRDATKLIESYLDEIHDRWQPVIDKWKG